MRYRGTVNFKEIDFKENQLVAAFSSKHKSTWIDRKEITIFVSYTNKQNFEVTQNELEHARIQTHIQIDPVS